MPEWEPITMWDADDVAWQNFKPLGVRFYTDNESRRRRLLRRIPGVRRLLRPAYIDLPVTEISGSAQVPGTVTLTWNASGIRIAGWGSVSTPEGTLVIHDEEEQE